MQFKYPEILFALFLLLIPIFIHLFQLRKFQKIDFTNVAFLRKVTLQTRKSSVLKKWLTLLMRLFALACLVIAFAQPFIASEDSGKEKEVVLYVDNAFSMQAKGRKGSLLEEASQEIYDHIALSRFDWFTNNTEYRNATAEDLKTEILKQSFSSINLSFKEILLKAETMFSTNPNSIKELLIVSDFRTDDVLPEIPVNIRVHTVGVTPISTANLAIDSLFIKSQTGSNIELQVAISKQGDGPTTVPISLYNGETLVAKTSVDFERQSNGHVIFEIDTSEEFVGRVTLTDAHIAFDNTLYFSINKPEPIQVLSINNADGNFLNRLFDATRFQVVQTTLNDLEYQKIENQQLIILNQLDEIPNALATALKAYKDADGSLLIIPSKNADIASYNELLSGTNLGVMTERIDEEKKIAKINFSHPLYADVFEKEVDNFQYPTVNSYFEVNSRAVSALRFEDQRPFLLQAEKTYLFTAPIDRENSNFINAPLIVPTLYNIGLKSLSLSALYYITGRQNTFSVPIRLGPDEILSLSGVDESFIPQQQTKTTYVDVFISDLPENDGNYEVKHKDEVIQHISFNYPRSQGRLTYTNLKQWQGATAHDSISEMFFDISKTDSDRGFWKWFAIFAVAFLIGEMLVLKLMK